MRPFAVSEIVPVDGHDNLYVVIVTLLHPDESAHVETRTFSGIDSYAQACSFVRLAERTLREAHCAKVLESIPDLHWVL